MPDDSTPLPVFFHLRGKRISIYYCNKYSTVVLPRNEHPIGSVRNPTINIFHWWCIFLPVAFQTPGCLTTFLLWSAAGRYDSTGSTAGPYCGREKEQQREL